MNTRIPRTTAEMRQFDETGYSRRQTAEQKKAEKQMKAAQAAYQKELGTYRPGMAERLQTLLHKFFK